MSEDFRHWVPRKRDLITPQRCPDLYVPADFQHAISFKSEGGNKEKEKKKKKKGEDWVLGDFFKN